MFSASEREPFYWVKSGNECVCGELSVATTCPPEYGS